MSKLESAIECYEARKARYQHPDGKFDKAGRWYPSASEEQSCCSGVRGPSRAYPYSYMTHCRSVEHIANLYGVDARELRKAVRKASPPVREGGENYYKAVAITEDGRMVSIYDGKTEYRIGETVVQAARQDHNGGIYVYPSLERARRVSVPDSSAAKDLPRAILRVRAEGNYCKYDNGKIAFSRVTPLEIVAQDPISQSA
jgi:hypothetical protein